MRPLAMGCKGGRTNWHSMWEGIGSKPFEFVEKAKRSCLAFHGINVEMIQDRESENSLRLVDSGWIEPHPQELEIMGRCIVTLTPLDSTLANTTSMDNCQFALRGITILYHLFITMTLYLRYIIPRQVRRARLSMMTKMNDNPNLIEVRWKETLSIPLLYLMEWSKSMLDKATILTKNRRTQAVMATILKCLQITALTQAIMGWGFHLYNMEEVVRAVR
jgi:hypothetical protein